MKGWQRTHPAITKGGFGNRKRKKRTEEAEREEMEEALVVEEKNKVLEAEKKERVLFYLSLFLSFSTALRLFFYESEASWLPAFSLSRIARCYERLAVTDIEKDRQTHGGRRPLYVRTALMQREMPHRKQSMLSRIRQNRDERPRAACQGEAT